MFFLRIAIIGIFAFTQSGYYIMITGILLIPVASMLSVVCPYKKNIYNVVDMVMILTSIHLYFSLIGYPYAAFDRRYEWFLDVMCASATFIPNIYALIQLFMYLLPNRLLEATKRYLQHALRKN